MTDKRNAKCRWLSRRVTASCLSIVIAFQTGCATLPGVPSTQHQTMLGKVALIASPQMPQIRFEGFSGSKLKGATSGAGNTFLECIGELGGGSCSGELCGPVMILMLGVCGVASAVGSVVGAITAPPGVDENQPSEETLTTALNARAIQESLKHQIEIAALARGARLAPISPETLQAAVQPGDYRQFANAGIDTLLDVALIEVSIIAADINAAPLLRMQAHVRLIRTRDNSDIFSTDYFYIVQKPRLADWSTNRVQRLLADMKTGYQLLGAHIIDNVFLLYPFPDRQPHWSGFLSFAFGLAPIYPPTRGQVTADPMTGEPISGNSLAWASVDTLRPTLRWQGFPRATDVKVAADEMRRVNNVRYDLVIAQAHDLAPVEIIYRREGLPDTIHTIETSLSPSTRYYWTVRARFKLDGRERVTEWGSTHFKVREQWTAPSILSYRFKTPQ